VAGSSVLAVVEQGVQRDRRGPRPAGGIERFLRHAPAALRFLALVAPGGVASPAGCGRRARAAASSQPASTSGRRLRVRVDASTFISRARSTGRTGPSLHHVRQQRVLRAAQAGLADLGVVVLRHAAHQLAQLEVGAALAA
jgi:hypothetical protein